MSRFLIPPDADCLDSDGQNSMLLRRWGLLAALVIAGATVSVLIVSVFYLYFVFYPLRRFDPVKWRNDTQVQQGVRFGMADGLIARRTLSGKTRKDLIEMLGPDSGRFGDWDMTYWLGPERSFISIDSEWLVIRFGKDGRVTDYRIVTD